MSVPSITSASMGERLLKLARFSGVGFTCFGLGLAILAGLHELAGVNYLVAYIVSFVATNITGYVLNARFTFQPESVDHLGAIRYMTVNAVLLIVNTVALKLLVDVMHMGYLLAAIILAAVNMPVSFVGQWLFTYRTGSGNRSAAARGRQAAGPASARRANVDQAEEKRREQDFRAS